MRSLWLIGSTFIGLFSTAILLVAVIKPAEANSAAQVGTELPTLSFAVVGDSRPAREDDVAGYPTSIITKIWQDVAAANPAIAVTTGNYMFAGPAHKPSTASTQLDLYLTAQSNYKGTVFHAMGNHECTGVNSSNCGPGNPDGMTANYQAFLSKMVRPGRHELPYYVEKFHGPNNSWTAKFVILAGNAWDAAQAAWLDKALSAPTNYTFIVRNPPIADTAAPCLSAAGDSNADKIIAKHPYTLLIVGHTYTYAYYAAQKEVIVGNGGAPLVGSGDYGYVIARQQSNGNMTFTEYDYNSNAAMNSFTVSP